MVRNSELKRNFVEIDHRLEMIETILLISNPDSPVAADAYNNLCRLVGRSVNATVTLYAVIAQLDAIAAATDDIEIIRVKLSELMAQYGLSKVEEYDQRPDVFERIGKGPKYTVTKPAYVALSEELAIQMGVAEGVAEVPPAMDTLEQLVDGDATASESSQEALSPVDTVDQGDAK